MLGRRPAAARRRSRRRDGGQTGLEAVDAVRLEAAADLEDEKFGSPANNRVGAAVSGGEAGLHGRRLEEDEVR